MKKKIINLGLEVYQLSSINSTSILEKQLDKERSARHKHEHFKNRARRIRSIMYNTLTRTSAYRKG